MEGDGQRASFIHELFEETDTTNFTGSVHCTAPENGMFTGVALEMDEAARIFTTLPVVPLNAAAVGGPKLTLDFAHFANGASNASDLVLVNVGTAAVRTAIYFFDPDGNPVDAGSVVDVADDLEVADGGALTLEKEIQPLGELTITTTGEGEVEDRIGESGSGCTHWRSSTFRHPGRRSGRCRGQCTSHGRRLPGPSPKGRDQYRCGNLQPGKRR